MKCNGRRCSWCSTSGTDDESTCEALAALSDSVRCLQWKRLGQIGYPWHVKIASISRETKGECFMIQ